MTPSPQRIAAKAILAGLAAAGIKATLTDGKIRLSPASAVGERLAGQVKAHRAEIIEELTGGTGERGSSDQNEHLTDNASPHAWHWPHTPVASGVDHRGWKRYACRVCGRFYGYGPPGTATMPLATVRTKSSEPSKRDAKGYRESPGMLIGRPSSNAEPVFGVR
jgi:hypothetical protein